MLLLVLLIPFDKPAINLFDYLAESIAFVSVTTLSTVSLELSGFTRVLSNSVLMLFTFRPNMNVPQQSSLLSSL